MPEKGWQIAEGGYHYCPQGRRLRAWYLGNLRFENHTVYKFDFTKITDKKYADCLTCQVFAAEDMGMRSMAFVTIDEPQFTAKKGYEFADGSKEDSVTIVEGVNGRTAGYGSDPVAGFSKLFC